MNMGNFGKVDYTKEEVPAEYKCSECEATGCKLWRDYGVSENQNLLCAKCAAKEQEKDISGINSCGQFKEGGKSTNRIGWRIPAIPREQGDMFWSENYVPMTGYAWWVCLPTLPEK
jgi:hypothetical protein